MFKNLLTVAKATPALLAFAAPLAEKVPTPAKTKELKDNLKNEKFMSEFNSHLADAYRRAYFELLSEKDKYEQISQSRRFEQILIEEMDKM